MRIDLRGKTAIVTGAAQGIGRAIAEQLHGAGAKVGLLDLDGVRAARIATEGLDSTGATAMGLVADVSNREAFARAFADVAARLGPVDILVNNAAQTVLRPFWDITDAEWDRVLATNLRSVFIGCQIAGTHMRDNRRGRIINLSSLAGQQGGTVTGAHYAASKAGIIALTKVVAKELAHSGVTVNAIAPAAIRTPLVVETLEPERLRALAASIPVGRLGETGEVSTLAAFLASDYAAYITGATFDVNGGLWMR